jgi:hypothetical protein
MLRVRGTTRMRIVDVKLVDCVLQTSIGAKDRGRRGRPRWVSRKPLHFGGDPLRKPRTERGL